MTQEQLSKLLDVSEALVSHIETGRRAITAKKAKNWTKITGIPLSKLCPEIFGRAA